MSIKYKNEKIIAKFQHASRVYRTTYFDFQMKKLKKIHKKAYRDLIQVNVLKWSRVYCSMRRYSMMTSNIVESINFSLRHARKFSVTTLAEFIDSMMKTWFYDRRNAIDRTNTMLTSPTSVHVTKYVDAAQYLIVKPG